MNPFLAFAVTICFVFVGVNLSDGSLEAPIAIGLGIIIGSTL